MTHREPATPAELFAGQREAPIRVPAPDADLRYWPALLDGVAAARWLDELRAQCAWCQHEVRIAGRRLPCPRLSAWHGDADAIYGYSGKRYTPAAWTPALTTLRTLVQDASGARFNSVLANLYRDGNDSMGWHSDDEPELGARPVIAALSLGAERRFLLRHRRRKAVPGIALDLAHGSLLLMAGETQANWRHSLPKTRRAVGPRISLTFRLVHAGLA